MRPGIRTIFIFAVVLATYGGVALAQFRFPMPEFETDYHHPTMNTPPPARDWPVIDTVALTAALGLGAWLVIRKRSRAGVLALTVFSLLYFGFWRKGCVCPVGSLQNVLAAALGESAGVPLVVATFFALPLLFALFFGRVFCAVVCPLGAIQEVAAVRPALLSRPLEATLGLLPYLYLGLVVLGIATGSGFLICQYDPFVGFFRFGASFNMFVAGGLLLLLGVFVGRPYCRFLCPYGVLLGWMSRLAKWHAAIPPTECVQCRLCEEACPYGAVLLPTPALPPGSRREGAKRVGLLLVVAPLVVAIGIGVGLLSHELLARMNPTVRLAERIAAEERGEFQTTTIESETFRALKRTPAELFAEAQVIRAEFRMGAAVLGCFMGVVVIVKLVALSLARPRKDYEANRVACLSCARCFRYCPVEETHGDKR